MGRVLHFSKREVSSYSFLLSLPLILGGMVFKFKELSMGSGSPQESLSWTMALIGLLSSFITGLLAIHFFLGLIKRIGFEVFFIYRLILASLLFYFF